MAAEMHPQEASGSSRLEKGGAIKRDEKRVGNS